MERKKSTFNYSQILAFQIPTYIEVIFGIYVVTFCRSKGCIRNTCFFFYVELHRNVFFLSNSFNVEPVTQLREFTATFAVFLICSLRSTAGLGVVLHHFLVDKPFYPSRPSPVTPPKKPFVVIPSSVSVKTLIHISVFYIIVIFCIQPNYLYSDLFLLDSSLSILSNTDKALSKDTNGNANLHRECP